jgi:cytochrome P450
MLTCILGLLEHPEVVKKAQAQIDAVVKPGHLPDLDDEESLPYISAIVSEALRWRDVTPIGLSFPRYDTTATYCHFRSAIPHSLSADDEYKGYYLPKGSVVIANSW